MSLEARSELDVDNGVNEPVDSTDSGEPNAVGTGSGLEWSTHLNEHLHDGEHNGDEVKYTRSVHSDKLNPENVEIAVSVEVEDVADGLAQWHDDEWDESSEKR